MSDCLETPITLDNVFGCSLGFEWHLALLAGVLILMWLVRRSTVPAFLRFALIVAAAVTGSLVGGDIGLIAGIAWDEATHNDWVSNALLTIPLGGLVGIIFMVWIATQFTRPRTTAAPRG